MVPHAAVRSVEPLQSSSHAFELESTIATALGVPAASITDDLAYRDIAEWDSLAHVRLMLEIEARYGVAITSDHVSELTSVGAIRAFLLNGLTLAPSPSPSVLRQLNSSRQVDETAPPPVHRGLAGIHFDRTAITHIDAGGNALRYRGYSVDELADRADFEQTAFLLIQGHLPRGEELAAFSAALRKARAIPASVERIVDALSDRPPFNALQAAVAALAETGPAAPDADLLAIAQFPTLLASYHRLRSGSQPLAPRPDLGHAANLLYLLQGRVPSDERAAALEATLVILADHSSSASTFAARIVTGTNASVHAALASAIGAFSGPLHGGAVDRVIAMAEEVGSAENAADFVNGRFARNEVVYGFGHRVYRTADPRSFRLRELAARLSTGNRRLLDILEAIPPALAHQARLGLDVNVDFYASAVFEALEIPRDLFGATFMAARIAGLVAHCREQRANNILIRPQLLYDGPAGRAYDTAHGAS
ncbi:hypothetical protein JQ557_05915 [Bradyrhizobium sp. U87765 SZCCT0131]|uniref:citrate/2-methylcitrate synthase n=1 Tax=unclassified Bradyrhizobium TaxID=2631580 RepID=UPI001BA7F9C5|nr:MULTISPECIES: citrate/2-methylcitrate synthase [unclassified Bradyrhizobium]MBR1217513.1 hypothetical protein [Bradyrhizobium sp. U87765 SZCCT0131]MBR1264889.1 hypothetical protein [Bradyrhizobium sp. U87765 SZCCT0134]MBR1304871.1 hypothetical protein [Bradyrhizobium sp. U87765 SZCCT0110]MBR1320658.1 hypothetical protein [Bradyrhizobium sp. U87765 SZCCT0109]MBR1349078.1 hypothetical protein [Bradyrhizobium sp. U87765 SZCCT0048]